MMFLGTGNKEIDVEISCGGAVVDTLDGGTKTGLSTVNCITEMMLLN